MPGPAPIVPVPLPIPPPGEMTQVAPGLHWVRLPLPLRLNHVNIWLADDDEGGWSAVDCGPDTVQARSLWEHLLAGPLAGRAARRLVATHGHLDHVGLSGWFAGRLDVPFHATPGEWQSAHLRHLQRDQAPMGQRSFLIRHGCPPELVAEMAQQRGEVMRMLGPQPPAFVRLRDSAVIRIGERDWQVIVTGGHADAHASFHCAADNVLIAGDQILPRITPVVGVFAWEPEADPLGDYLASFGRFAHIDEDCLVLPSHGEPFRNLPGRITQLRAHHAQRLDRAMEALEAPRTAWSVAGILFERAVGQGHGRLALAETLAHLHRLMAERRIIRVEEVETGLVHFMRD